jgi:CRISPR-associated protein Cmr6
MAIAAVPAYLGQDFSQASPGLRFGMYLPLWGEDQRSDALTWNTHDDAYEVRGQAREERQVRAENKRPALNTALPLTPQDLALMRALATRQSALAAAMGDSIASFDALSTAPFTTGLGNEHPLENGFAFLNPYGLPYLAGSGVKGVLRQAARELVSGEWGEAKGWTKDAITGLFGLESEDGDQKHHRGALSFWDVLPAMPGDRLQVEVMTPHQSHYYQPPKDTKPGARPSPHDSGQPNPIHFLTVPPGSRMAFHVRCDEPFLRRHDLPEARALADGGRWRELLQAAFTHAFDWLGFGAKTAVGYGAMQIDRAEQAKREQAQAERQAQAKAQAEQARRATLSPEDRAWAEAEPVIAAFRAEWDKARKVVYNPGGPFNDVRRAFMKTAETWTETRSRAAAAEALAASATKAWGRPSNKDRWAEMQATIERLKGQP